MIRLEVEERCHSCLEFVASINKVESYGAGEIVDVEYYITCGNAGLCRRIREHMKQCGIKQE